MNQKCEPMINLKVMRVRRGVTIQALSDKTGISYSTIVRYERGYTQPKLSNLNRIAEALTCRVEEII